MDTSADSVDSLAARTAIKDYSDLTNGYDIRQMHTATPAYAESLITRLGCMTPPLDEEEESNESRALEAKARQELECEGCPPCYPPGWDTLESIPEEYQAIVRYWKSFPRTDDVVLCAQLSDWRRFRTSQGRVRARHRNDLGAYVDEVDERRRRHQLGGKVHILSDSERQTRLENWFEFQNYHLRRLERSVEKRDKLRKELNDIGKREDLETIRQGLGFAKRDLERRKVLLTWIKRQRRTMDPGYSSFIEKIGDPGAAQVVRGSLPRNRGTKRVATSVVLGKAKVTKAKQKKRRMQRKPSGVEPDIQDWEVTQSDIPQRRDVRPQRSKETPLDPLCPQRVSKARPRSRTQRRNAGQSQSPKPVRSQLVSATTRSGRISKPPVRWVPS